MIQIYQLKKQKFINSVSAYIIVLLVLLIYVYFSGPIGFFPDAYIYSERGRALIDNHSISINADDPIFYPPLYSIYISPAFLIKNSLVSQKIIMILNAIVLSYSVIPLRKLLTEYCYFLKPIHVWSLSIIFSLSPWVIQYCSMIFAESLYYTLFIYSLLFRFRFYCKNSGKSALKFGAAVSACALTRDWGVVMFGAYLMQAILDTVRVYNSRAEVIKKIIVHSQWIISFLIPLIIWKILEIYKLDGMAPYYQGGEISYIIKHLNFIKSFSWAIGGVMYVLLGTITVFPLLGLFTAIRSPRILLTDPMVQLAFLCPAAVACAIFFAQRIYAEPFFFTITRYYDMVLIIPVLVGIRYINEVNVIVVKSFILFAGICLFFELPFSLPLALPGGLVVFEPRSIFADGLLVNLLYFFVILTCIIVLFIKKAQANALIISVIALIYAYAGLSQLNHWQKQKHMNLDNYRELVRLNGNLNKLTKPAKYFYFRSKDEKNNWEIGMYAELTQLLFFLPKWSALTTLEQVVSYAKRHPSEQVFLATDKLFVGVPVIYQSTTFVSLYDISKSLVDLEKLVIINSIQGVGGQETFTQKDGNNIPIAWLDPIVEIKLSSNFGGCIRIGMKLANPGNSSKISLKLNGVLVSEDIEINKTLWKDGSDQVSWEIDLPAGSSSLQFKSTNPQNLPYGRQVGFLLVDHVITEQCH